MKTLKRVRPNASAARTAQQAPTPKGNPAPKPAGITGTHEAWDLVVKPDGSYFMANTTEMRPLTEAEAAEFCLRRYVPAEFRHLLETHKFEAKMALEDCVQESIGLFALLETFLSDALTGESRWTQERGDHIMAGILHITHGFKGRLANAFNQFYPNGKPLYVQQG